MIGLTAAEYLQSPSYRSALMFANKLRARQVAPPLHELEFLPPGEGCRNPLEVAVPFALAIGVTSAWLPWTRGRMSEPLPELAGQFLEDWQTGRYPDLLPLPGVACEASSHRPTCAQSAWRRIRAARV